jgi:hypothetical protein
MGWCSVMDPCGGFSIEEGHVFTEKSSLMM